MKTVYAYSVVYKESDGKMKHSLNHCYADNKQEARGWAHEQFEEDYPDCRLMSLLIREIVPDSDVLPRSHEYNTGHIQPEFTLKPNF